MLAPRCVLAWLRFGRRFSFSEPIALGFSFSSRSPLLLFLIAASQLPDSGFRFRTYGPDKTQEFATYRCDVFLLSLPVAASLASGDRCMQSVLSSDDDPS